VEVSLVFIWLSQKKKTKLENMQLSIVQDKSFPERVYHWIEWLVISNYPALTI
jgi:hypothetical protein